MRPHSGMVHGKAEVDLSIIIPCFNEASSIAQTVVDLCDAMEEQNISYEILCINNNSTDGTGDVLLDLASKYMSVRYTSSPYISGYGIAVRWGLEHYVGKSVVICMGDGSESPADVVRFFKKLNDGYDCVFGSRFMGGSTLEGYPRFKLLLNRIGNKLIAAVTHFDYDDFTNGFKCYRRELIEAISPLFSESFNLTVEMSVSAILNHPTIAIVPNSWRERRGGASKFRVLDETKLYLMTLFYSYLRRKIQGESWNIFRQSVVDKSIMHQEQISKVAPSADGTHCD